MISATLNPEIASNIHTNQQNTHINLTYTDLFNVYKVTMLANRP